MRTFAQNRGKARLTSIDDKESFHLGQLGGAGVGVQPTLDGRDILIEHCDLGQRFACLLAFRKADLVRQGAAYY